MKKILIACIFILTSCVQNSNLPLDKGIPPQQTKHVDPKTRNKLCLSQCDFLTSRCIAFSPRSTQSCNEGLPICYDAGPPN